MEEEIEDIASEVKYSDSQKSIATSNVYSMDFTDSNSEKHNSSSKDTYVIDLLDSEDSEIYPLEETRSLANLAITSKGQNRDVNVQCQMVNQVVTKKMLKTTSTSIENCAIVAQETFTQTSKTILELAQADKSTDHLETQTSFISVTENKTVAYRIEMSKTNINHEKETDKVAQHKPLTNDQILSNYLDDKSSKFIISDVDTVVSDVDGNVLNAVESKETIPNVIQDDSKENFYDIANESFYGNNSDFYEDSDSDIEEDSLMETHTRKVKNVSDNVSETSNPPNSVDGEIEELYNKLSQSMDLNIDMDMETPPKQQKRLETLTPLTEESSKKENVIDITPDDTNMVTTSNRRNEFTLFTNDDGFKIKMLPLEDHKLSFKLPPIRNRSCPNSPHLNFLFSLNTSSGMNKANTLPCLHEDAGVGDSWDVNRKDFSTEEDAAKMEESLKQNKDKEVIQLPPIHLEGYVVNSNITKTNSVLSNVVNINPSPSPKDSISINEKIKELKTSSGTKYIRPKMIDQRCGSPISVNEEVRSETAERACEALCQETLKKLRSNSWFDVIDQLEEIPKTLDKFWDVISEPRIADLVRQVTVHIESPRTQVARAACHTVATILKNTNYTKKPDFYEAITLLLTKTGSYSTPVRRAANLALDEIVCAVDISHAITALCVHGTSHKSGSVRGAAARLLVVCCGVRGGRGVLRARPPTAATARRHALRALATLLDDKNTDARKYAERLYLMLRPHNSFEAYYLTDVNVELATSQMKKYDKLLLNTKVIR